ncbi:glycosyltransferase [Methylobacterium sp. A54F]
MSRLVYLGFPTPHVAGGQKMILRHVEALRELGFNAVFWMNESGVLPRWFKHNVPAEVATAFQKDDVLVVPGDAPNAIRHLAGLPNRTLIFCQNHYSFASVGYEAMQAFRPHAFPTIITVGRICSASVARAFPQAQIEVIPCFADERKFQPCEAKRRVIASAPRKRQDEARIIQSFFQRYHPRHSDWGWALYQEASEEVVADGFAGAGVFLNLARIEAVGMTALEAMASGCVVAGFTGIGGREYATAANGFWVEEDDLEGAADALARAVDLFLAGGAPLHAYREAAAITAQAWSYRAFQSALDEVWTRLAPEACTLAGRPAE